MNSQARPRSSAVPFRQVSWMERDIEIDRRPDGAIYMQSRIPLQPIARHIPSFLEKWANERPEQVWLAQRGTAGDWETLTYQEGKRSVDAMTQALLGIPGASNGPLAILSGNSIEHAIVAMAAMQARIPIAPISPAYSLQSADHTKLKYIFELISPAVVFAQDTDAFGAAISSIDRPNLPIIKVRGTWGGLALKFGDLLSTEPTDQVRQSVDQIVPETVAKFLFTSGSTGMPKAVITTHRMMCANVAMVMQAMQLDAKPAEAKYLDWLPWSHVMGGNGVFNIVLARGFSLYIDDGKPVAGLFDKTIRNLRDISPISYTNAPAGFTALATALEQDEALCRSFFKNLRVLTYGGARLPDDVYERIQELAVRTIGERIVFTTTFGATETAPAATMTYWNTERVGLIGLPCPGIELKLLPLLEGKFEIRIRGVTVTPGYHGRLDLTAAAFDEEGFYKIGDMVEFVDPNEPHRGLTFAGRVVEDFKLLSGTFVLVGSLRVDAIAAASPLISDALVAGHDRNCVGLLAWPDVEACRRFIGGTTLSVQEIVSHPSIVEYIRSGLKAHNVANGEAGSRRIARVMLLTDPPSIDGNEITDKGYINQRAGLQRRAAEVERLYLDPAPDDVIVIPQ